MDKKFFRILFFSIFVLLFNVFLVSNVLAITWAQCPAGSADGSGCNQNQNGGFNGTCIQQLGVSGTICCDVSGLQPATGPCGPSGARECCSTDEVCYVHLADPVTGVSKGDCCGVGKKLYGPAGDQICCGPDEGCCSTVADCPSPEKTCNSDNTQVITYNYKCDGSSKRCVKFPEETKPCQDPDIKLTCKSNAPVKNTSIVKETITYTCKSKVGGTPGKDDECRANPATIENDPVPVAPNEAKRGPCVGLINTECGNNNDIEQTFNKCIPGSDHCINSKKVVKTCGSEINGVQCIGTGIGMTETLYKCAGGSCVPAGTQTMPPVPCPTFDVTICTGGAVGLRVSASGCKNQPTPTCGMDITPTPCGECLPGVTSSDGCPGTDSAKTCGTNGKWGACKKPGDGEGGGGETPGNTCSLIDVINDCGDGKTQKCEDDGTGNKTWSECHTTSTTACNVQGQCVESPEPDGSECEVGDGSKCTHCNKTTRKCVAGYEAGYGGFFDGSGCVAGEDCVPPIPPNPPTPPNPAEKGTSCVFGRCIWSFIPDDSGCTAGEYCSDNPNDSDDTDDSDLYEQGTTCTDTDSGRCVATYFPDDSNCAVGYDAKCGPHNFSETACNLQGQCYLTDNGDNSGCSVSDNSETGNPECDNTHTGICPDCGVSGLVGLPFCYDGDNVFRNYITYSCVNGSCRSDTTKIWQKSCTLDEHCLDGKCVLSEDSSEDDSTEGEFCANELDCSAGLICSSGSCVKCQNNSECPEGVCTADGLCVTPVCSSNSNCGADHPSLPFCRNGNIYQNSIRYICHNAGLSNAYCASEISSINLITSCDSDQNCYNSACVDKIKCVDGACENPDLTCDTETGFCVPKAKLPTVINLTADPGNYCSSIPGAGLATFSWKYNGTGSQTDWWLQVSTSNDFKNVIYDSQKQHGASSSSSTFSTTVKVKTQACLTGKCDFIRYNTQYYWRVKVWNGNLESGWTASLAFKYKWKHPGPWVSYIGEPKDPAPGDKVTFSDISQCYRSNGDSYFCNNPSKDGDTSYRLNTGIAGIGPEIRDCSSSDSTVCGNIANPNSYNTPKQYNTTLRITDTDCSYSGDDCSCTGTYSFKVKSSNANKIPQWEEISPF